MRALIGLCLFLTSILAYGEELDVIYLDKLASQQKYEEVYKAMQHIQNNDEKAINWLRSHANEWHPPLLHLLSLILFEKAIISPSQTLVTEQSQAYARSKTTFYIDKADCVVRTPQMMNKFEEINLANIPIEDQMRPYPKSIYIIGGDALQWAINTLKLRGGLLAPPAIWLCGEGNIKPDTERQNARAIALQELATQLLMGYRDATSQNPSEKNQ